MQDLIKQEQFELEVLDMLNTKRLLDLLILGGGTMLRLCLGLDRFSVDLDFWVIKNLDFKDLFTRLNKYLLTKYDIKDCANKFHTLLFEVKSDIYPRSLKIEIRKEIKKIKTEQSIAFSKYSNTQVLLNIVSPTDMMREKINAFLDRKEIRDVYDIEFLFKRGQDLDFPSETLEKLIKQIDLLSKKDYTVKLGSLLEEDKRKYYKSENFKILKQAIVSRLSS
jgi:predicted nucleotidyltransferase component of viral defense system